MAASSSNTPLSSTSSMAASSSNTPLASTFSEDKWLDQTRKNLQNQSPLDLNIPIAVCQVPNSISVVNPQAYAPQVISLGPYHYLQPELYQMERYKIEMVKSYWNPDQIELVVNKLKEIGPMVRACYHKYLDMNDDTLALMLAIDGLFLIYLLSKRLNRFTEDASVFRDVMMLENQIPMILLREIVNTISLPDNDDVKILFLMMRVFCESQLPFGLQSNQPDHDLEEKKVLHLLDLLHKMITWGMLSNLLGLSSGHKEVATKNPLVEEIDIPSVSKLSRMAGIAFEPVNSGNLKARFDKVAATLYLPVITLNGNSEVILHNLMAYEMASSSTTSGNKNHVLTQYLDLMSGIIDTEEDARLLQRAGIIKGDLANSQVADLFNGMNKSSQKVYNDDTAARINAYYQQKSKVKAYRFVKKYVYKSWRCLTVVSMLLLLSLTILQSFCSVYDCKGVVN